MFAAESVHASPVSARPIERGSAPASARPIAAVEHVVIISLDGLRPDLLLRADTPVVHGLMRDGSYSFWAHTTDVAITLPSHTSMLTGVTPAKHHVLWNSDDALHLRSFPARPTILELAHGAGLTSAMIAGKSKFRTLDKPGTIDRAFFPPAMNASVGNATVTENALKLYAEGERRPDLMFVHFPDVDAAGHARGWGSPEQIAAIEETDREIGRLLGKLDRAHTIILVSADHGGEGVNHGAHDPRSRFIPWIISGPGVKHGYDLTRETGLQIATEDTAATALWLLGLPLPSYLDGKVVRGAFEGSAADVAVRHRGR